MRTADVYTVVITFTYKTEAESVSDANEKADAHLAAHPDEADHQVTQTEVQVEEEA